MDKTRQQVIAKLGTLMLANAELAAAIEDLTEQVRALTLENEALKAAATEPGLPLANGAGVH
ncbi:MAG: hypothetical protein JSS20_18645 [Proteobacteria bacterium]|nr:hypothetical protein [Pseudomonadota bacterium]